MKQQHHHEAVQKRKASLDFSELTLIFQATIPLELP